jgi:hypothetical protein
MILNRMSNNQVNLKISEFRNRLNQDLITEKFLYQPLMRMKEFSIMITNNCHIQQRKLLISIKIPQKKNLMI